MSEEKHKRFDRFKSSVSGRLSPEGPGRKRFRRDSLDLKPPFSKRICRELPAQPTKNIANSRLQRIKEQLKLDLLAEGSGPQVIPVNTTPISNIQIQSRSQAKNIYQNLGKWASPPDPSQNNKNLANQRLNRLKKNVLAVNSTNQTPDNCDKINKNVFLKNKTPEKTDNCTLTTSRVSSAVTLGLGSPPKGEFIRPLNNNSVFSLTNSDNFKALNFDDQNKTHRSPLLTGIQINSVDRRFEYKSNDSFAANTLPERSETPATSKNNETSVDIFKSSLVTQSDQKLNNAHFTSKNFKMPNTDTHRSPLFTGVKRNLNDSSYECSSPKRKVPDLLPIQSFNSGKTSIPTVNYSSAGKNSCSNSNKSLGTTLENSPQSPTTKKISDRLIKPSVKKDTNSDSGVQLKMCNSSVLETDKPVDTNTHLTPIANTTHSTQNVSKNIEPSDSYLARMERTALWVKNIRGNNSEFEDLNDKRASFEYDLSSCSKVPFPDEDIEEMEWTNAEPDDEKRGSKDEDDLHENINNAVEEPVDQKQEKLKNICVVVDTNIFILNLSKVKDILSMKMPATSGPVIYIPWMVISELDYIKDSENCKKDKLKQNIMKSIKFINTCLKEKHPQVIAQTVFDVEKQKQVGPSQDDKIVSCCLQVAEKYETVILLSNDMNLKNKAMINGISACAANEIIMKIMSKLVTSVKYKKVEQKMSILCSSIICELAKETFGDVWSKMDLLSCPPWSFSECLKRFKKYWGTIFKDKVMKQFTKTLDELIKLLHNNKCISDDSEDYVTFVKLCITLGVYLKDIENCRGSVETTLKDITRRIS